MNEYIPSGYINMTAYNRRRAKIERVKYWASGILGAILLFSAYAIVGYIDTAF